MRRTFTGAGKDRFVRGPKDEPLSPEEVAQNADPGGMARRLVNATAEVGAGYQEQLKILTDQLQDRERIQKELSQLSVLLQDKYPVEWAGARAQGASSIGLATAQLRMMRA